jgi:hypothetical protein
MMAPFMNGEDFHSNTTRDVFKSDLELLASWTASKDIEGYLGFLKRPMMLEIRHYCYTHYIYNCPDEDDETTWTMKPVEEIEFGKLYDMSWDYLRFLTKFITFGIMYGRKAPSLANGELNCTVGEAQKYIDNFHKKYKGFGKWMKEQEDKALKDGFVETAFGFKRRWKFITKDLVYAIKNQAVNTPIQGTAAQICLLAVANLHAALKQRGWGWILFTVHDSIVCEIKKAHLQQALTLIRDIMTVQPLDTEVPLEIDLEVGSRYGNVEKVKPKDNWWIPGKPDKASDWLKELLPAS